MAAEGSGKVMVSKRSARTYIEDEMEAVVAAVPNSDQVLVRSNTKQSVTDNIVNSTIEERGRKNSTSTSSSGSGQSSRQTSMEAPSLAAVKVSSEWEKKEVAIANKTKIEGRHGSDTSTTSSLSSSSGMFLEPKLKSEGGAFEMHQSTALQFEEMLPKTGSRPANFGVVVPGVYRSSFPQADDHEFISRLGLKTIVTLVQKDFPEGYDKFIHQNRIKHHVFDMRGTKKERIPDKTMKAILGLVMNQANHPLLIHCNHGKHRTGCVVAVVRILTGWDMGHVVDEYKSFAEPKVRECDIEYIRGFEPGRISNLFARDGAAQARFRRATAFVAFVLLVWLASGRSITGGGAAQAAVADGRLL